MSPTDPVVLASIACVLAAAAVLASWLPARCATMVILVTVLGVIPVGRYLYGT